MWNAGRNWFDSLLMNRLSLSHCRWPFLEGNLMSREAISLDRMRHWTVFFVVSHSILC